MTQRYFIAVFLSFFLLTIGLEARNPHKHTQASTYQSNLRNRTIISLGNWEYWLRNDGQSAHTPDGNFGGIYPASTASVIYQDGLIWGCRVNDNNPNLPEIRVGGQTYNVGTTAGYVASPGPNPVASEETPIWRIRRDRQRFFDGADGTGEPVLHFPEIIKEAAARFQIARTSVSDNQQREIIEQYRSDWQNWPVHLGAPYYDVNFDDSYTPGLEIDLNGNGVIETGEREEPGYALADQIVYYVNHDLNPQTTNALFGSPPIGLEIQNVIWVYDQPDETLGQMLFKQYTLINKSGYLLDSMFIGQWSDPDVGQFTDDYVGVDSSRALGYAYSGFPNDNDFDAFNLPPAAAGYDYLQGPLIAGKPGEDRNRNGVDDALDYGVFNLQEVGPGKINLPLTSFVYRPPCFNCHPGPFGDYQLTEELYNYLNGYRPESFSIPPIPFLVGSGPKRGLPTKFPLSGDPFNETGDIDGLGDNPQRGDRQMMLSSGPFALPPGESQQVLIALIGGITGGENSNNLTSVLQLWQNSDFAQFMYDQRFQVVPAPPAAPVAKAIPLENGVMLDFGSDLNAVRNTELLNTPTGYRFEGYNIYQLPIADASLGEATKIATLDKKNTIKRIRAPRYVPDLGEIVDITIQSGSNSGIRRYFYVEKDFINDLPLYAGLEYHFALTAYNAKDTNGDGLVDTDMPDPALESALNILTVIPQGNKPGERRPVPGSFAEVDASGATSNGAVSVRIIDPTALTGHDYEVSFVTQTSSSGLRQRTWTLTDVTDSRIVVEGQQQLSNVIGNNDAPFYEGFQIKVSGPPAGIDTTRPGPFGDIPDGNNGWNWRNGDRWVSGQNWGGVSFFNGMSTGAQFLGSTLINGEDFANVELLFAGDTQANQPDRWSEGYVYHRSSNYAFAGIGSMPFTAWNVETGEQLIVCFVEDANEGSANMTWDMGWDGSAFAQDGGHEYLFITNNPYGNGPNPSDPLFSQDGIIEGGIPCMYAIWPQARGSRPYLLESFDMQIFASNVNTENDVFRFSTQAIEFDAQQARLDVKQINVFPNPFYGINSEATSAFNSYITFTNLPQEAIIRIFSIGGNQVVKLKKNDESQFLRWNMRNKVGLQVASGLYIAHIKLPGINTEKILKFFIIQGDEIPEVF